MRSRAGRVRPQHHVGLVRIARRIGLTLYLAVGPIWFAACSRITEPTATLPTGAVPFATPAAYRQWWNLTQQCSGLTGNLDAVQFYRVPGTNAFSLPSGGTANGAWYSRGNIIVVAGDSTLSGQIVRHEMLHALIGPVSGHPADYYGTKCGGIVICSNSCATEVAASPPTMDPFSPFVDANTMQIEAFALPTDLATARTNGVMTFVVKVTNPNAFSVHVRLQKTVFGTTYNGFGSNFNGDRRTELRAGATIDLPAHGSVQRAFDQVISLLTTTARFRGAFAAESSTVITSP